MTEAPFTDKEAFPQRGDGDAILPMPDKGFVRGPQHFIDGENILFMRPTEVENWSLEKNEFRMTCASTGYLNRTCQTHDSRMHQFLPKPKEVGKLHFVLRFWTPEIFRIMFSDNDGALARHTDEPAFPPPEARMLVGKAEDVKIHQKEEKDAIMLTSAAVRLVIQKKPCVMKAYFTSGKVFWQQRVSDLFTSDVIPTSVSHNNGRTACFESFSMAPQEHIYGLGERFDAVSRRGRTTDFWNYDAIGTSNPRTYINVPFVFSTSGYGLYLNSHARTHWDVGVTEANSMGFAIEDAYMDYFIIAGPTPQEILQRYTMNLTGEAKRPPLWTFGLWLSRNSYRSWDVVKEIVGKAKSNEIPFDVIHLDTSWFKSDSDLDLLWDESRFPNYQAEQAKLLEDGVRVSLWQYPFVPPNEGNPLYQEGKKGGFFGMSKDDPKAIFKYPSGTTGSYVDDCVVDFSNPEAAEWWSAKIRGLISDGSTAIKTDFGDCVAEEAVYQRISGTKFHNLYPLVYNAYVQQAITSVNREGTVWARSGTAGSQRYPIHWGGDSQCSWSGLAGEVRATISIGLSGFAYFTNDLGGFIGRPDDELYIRWAQMVLWCSHSRLHGAGNKNGREPWTFGEQPTEVFRFFDQLRYRLLPYIYSQGALGSKRGLPMVRAMVLEFPEDRNVWDLEDQYMFGDSFLLAPILEPMGDQPTRTLYLPKGRWFDFWTNEMCESHGEWIERKVTLERFPVFVKDETILPLCPWKMSTFNTMSRVDCVQIYSSSGSGVWEFMEEEGRRLKVVIRSGQVSVDVDGPDASHKPKVKLMKSSA